MNESGKMGSLTALLSQEAIMTGNDTVFRLLFEQAGLGIAIIDLDGCISSVNNAFGSMLGYTAAELQSRSFLGIMHQDDREKILAHFRQLLAGETNGSTTALCRYTHKSGHGVQAQVTTILLKDAESFPKWFVSHVTESTHDGQIKGVAVFARDITETKQAEELTNVERQEFQLIAGHGPFGTCILDQSGKIVYLNPMITEILGYGIDDIPDDEHWFQATCPDPEIRRKSQDYWNGEFRKLKPGECRALSLPVVCKNGDEKMICFRIMSLDSGGRIVSLEDITERVAGERILKDSERRYRRLFEDSPISLWEEDFSSVKSYIEMLKSSGVSDFRAYFEENPDTVAECARMVKVIDVNQATLDLYEAESKEALLEDLNKVFVKESLDVFREEIIRIAEGVTEFEAESINVSLRGNLKHVSARIIIAPGFEENLSKVIVSILDITDKKRAEERLKASLREKEVLLSEIHHRVKNNLQIMSSLLRLQARQISDPGYKRIFLESQDRVQSMALIHENLYESQDLGNVDFQGYVNRLVNNLFHSYGIDKSAVKYKSEIDSVTIGMDSAVPCGLIINELISNSLKHAFTRSELGEIGVSLNSNGDKRFELTVWDNGIGVGKRFASGKTRTLGFRLVTTLVRQLRGTITLDHCPGTKFIIRFCT